MRSPQVQFPHPIIYLGLVTLASSVSSFFSVLKHFKTNPRHHVISTYRLQYVSLKPMGSFLHHHSAVIIPKQLNANPWYHLKPSPQSKSLCCFLTGGLFKLESNSNTPFHMVVTNLSLFNAGKVCLLFIFLFHVIDSFFKKNKKNQLSVDLKNVPHYRCVSLFLLSLLFPVNWKVSSRD